METNTTDAKLVDELRTASYDDQLWVANYLVKTDRWDIINAARIPGLLERLKNNSESQEFIASKNENASTENGPGANELKKQWDNDASLRAEFDNDLESYLAYSMAVDSGCVKLSKERGSI